MEDLPKRFDVKIIGADDCEECSLVSNAFRRTSSVVVVCCSWNWTSRCFVAVSIVYRPFFENKNLLTVLSSIPLMKAGSKQMWCSMVQRCKTLLSAVARIGPSNRTLNHRATPLTTFDLFAFPSNFPHFFILFFFISAHLRVSGYSLWGISLSNSSHQGNLSVHFQEIADFIEAEQCRCLDIASCIPLKNNIATK